MDLIYANAQMEDQGVFLNPILDLAFGDDENNFEMTVSTANHCCESGFIIYCEGTEYGGVIDRIRVETENKLVVYGGRTWHGILESKVIEPDTGEDYLVVSGEANQVLQTLIERLGLDDLFEASSEDSGITITSYQFNRYVKGYTGIRKMLKSVGAKLHFVFEDGQMTISALPIVDYSQDDEFDSDQIKFVIEKNYRPVNHLICLGRGELAEREVIHLYVDTEGTISTVQTQFGLDEVTDTYDNANVESLEELDKLGRETLEEAMQDGKLELQLDASQEYDIDDIVGARELVTGITMSKPIIKKIVTINKNQIKIEHKVGE